MFAGQAPPILGAAAFGAKSTKDWSGRGPHHQGLGPAIGARRLASVAEMAERMDIESEFARSEGFREQAIEAVAGAVEEVCRCIAQLFAAEVGGRPAHGPPGLALEFSSRSR